MSEISRETLLRGLALSRPAVAQQAYIASLTHYAFDGYMVAAYNDVSAIAVRTPLELECCLPADTLTKALNSISADRVDVELGETNSVTLTAGRTKIKVPYLALDMFPLKIPTEEPRCSFDVTDTMLKGIEKCLVGVGTDPTHPAQMGVTLDPKKSGVAFYATDNTTISRYVTTDKVKLPGDAPIIMPTFFCTQLISLAKAFPDAGIKVELHKGAFVARFYEEAILFTKNLVDATPMDFDSIISRYLEGEDLAAVSSEIPDGFEAAIVRALLILEGEADKSTKISTKSHRMRMFSSSGLGEATDTLEYKGDDTEAFYADPLLLSRASKLCTQVALMPRVVVMTAGPFTHMIAHCSA